MMTFEQAKACVLYEDNHLLVVCKPVNMPVQADASGDEDLLTAMKAYVKQAYKETPQFAEKLKFYQDKYLTKIDEVEAME